MSVIKHLMDPIDFHSIKNIVWNLIYVFSSLFKNKVTNLILKIIFRKVYFQGKSIVYF